MNGRTSAHALRVPGALWTLWVVGWLLVLLAACPAFAQDVQPVPTLTSRVIDNTGTLTADQRDTLEAKLELSEQSARSQRLAERLDHLARRLGPEPGLEELQAVAHTAIGRLTAEASLWREGVSRRQLYRP